MPADCGRSDHVSGLRWRAVHDVLARIHYNCGSGKIRDSQKNGNHAKRQTRLAIEPIKDKGRYLE